LKVAEKIVGHKWTSMGTDENKKKYENKAKKTDYDFAPDLDSSILDSQKNLADTEGKLKHTYKLVQQPNAGIFLQLQSDPICASSGCDQYKHPDSKDEKWDMNYPVPNFGMDRDIQGGLINLNVAEGIVKHHWPGIGDEYKNKAKKADYNFAPDLDADIITS